LSAPVTLVTGGSRGIGAATAILLAKRGSDIAINFRSKEARARDVASSVAELDRRCLIVQADLTVPDQIAALTERVRSEFGRVDHLILNAAGGLERDRDESYAFALNVTANDRLVDTLLPIMPAGGSVVFVTSHPSHFFGRLPIMAGYERVASTKKAAEDMLRGRIGELSAAGIRLAVVSGDLIEGTINAKLMQREYPGLLADRAREVGSLPTVDEFSEAIVGAALDGNLETGATVLVGSTSWETYRALTDRERSDSTT
jgi:NAD(P)-dependent dehydrogenase (short-subunit alcohol dehydrogenase family)